MPQLEEWGKLVVVLGVERIVDRLNKRVGSDDLELCPYRSHSIFLLGPRSFLKKKKKRVSLANRDRRELNQSTTF